ncbi:very-long-chain 3-oxoacyl-CoA reductase 1-like [Dorcoceras hygrometricum]|uniref:Very-long-chain 3-oxoacyl-CoA reductase 1-like n=1 Tax=Dorcoceras hygrometricum TaxID=472368 RepID=A0A2Z7B821_9LAMI|nr:very-long-chain 3-oxoacyl-CoA reductase 1-like [Dorcoceras hygrometricum]
MASAATTREEGRGEEFAEKLLLLLGSHTPNLPPTILNTLSTISVRELGNQYLCNPQWFRDTTSHEITIFVTPKTHFRTYPSNHGKSSSNIARGESSTTKHQLLHASGPHPTPPPDDLN